MGDVVDLTNDLAMIAAAHRRAGMAGGADDDVIVLDDDTPVALVARRPPVGGVSAALALRTSRAAGMSATAPAGGPIGVSGAGAVKPQVTLTARDVMSCPICMDNFRAELPVATACGHVFHRSCASKHISTRRACPMCSKTAKLTDLRVIYI